MAAICRASSRRFGHCQAAIRSLWSFASDLQIYCDWEDMSRPALHCASRKMVIGLICLEFGFVGATVLPAVGQQTDRAAVDQKLKAGKSKLLEAENQAKALESSVREINLQREELGARLIATGREIQAAEQRMTSIEDRLGKLNAEKEAAQKRLVGSYASISTLLAAMQRMGRNPPPVIVTKRKDALEAVRSAMLMARAFPHLREQADRLGGELQTLEDLITDIAAKRDDLSAETRKLTDAQVSLKSLIEARKATADQRQDQLNKVRQSAAQIASNVKSLSDLIGQLDEEVRDKTGLGEYDRREGSDEQKVAAAPPPGGPAFQYKPSGSVFSGKPGRMKPAIPFHQAKAMLPMPAAGRRIVSFGEETELEPSAKGISLATRHGAQITSPCDGWIVYAGVFRSYGQLLIINAGDGYHVLLSGLSTIDVQVGQFVLASEPVGTMAIRSKGKSQDSAPVLYVEFRKEGRPIDPEPWWFKDQRRVQG